MPWRWRHPARARARRRRSSSQLCICECDEGRKPETSQIKREEAGFGRALLIKSPLARVGSGWTSAPFAITMVHLTKGKCKSGTFNQDSTQDWSKSGGRPWSSQRELVCSDRFNGWLTSDMFCTTSLDTSSCPYLRSDVFSPIRTVVFTRASENILPRATSHPDPHHRTVPDLPTHPAAATQPVAARE